jgi:predicted outer membrane repeat protein
VDEANNNYHLLSTEGYWTPLGWEPSSNEHSPCIDAGDPESNWFTEPENNGHRANVGAYGNTSKASKSNIQIIYVDANTTCINPPNYYGNGSSWEEAYKYLQDALEEAEENQNYEIWVSAGTYYPDWDTELKIVTGDQSASFELKNGVEIYGGFDYQNGFDGWEDRNWEEHLTVLSGDIGVIDDISDNSYHVVNNTAISNLDNTAVLDGFIITKGNANEPDYTNGGGMKNVDCSPTISNCKFIDNYANNQGGGMYNYCNNFHSYPVLSNCTFKNNTAFQGGGMFNDGFYNNYSQVLLNCTFDNNIAVDGGGIYNYYCTSEINNCTFINNEATGEVSDYGEGGGIMFHNTSTNISNSLFESNTAERGAGINYKGNYIGNSTITDCEFKNNLSTDNGAGLFGSSCFIEVSGCKFINNISLTTGGGIFIVRSELMVSGCSFLNNEAISGGGLYYIRGNIFSEELYDVTICYSIFSGNSASYSGGGIYFEGYSVGTPILIYPNVFNCSFSNNEATDGSAIDNYFASPSITNCILWGESEDQIHAIAGNPQVRYSDIKGTYNGTGNICELPLFVDTKNHDLHLKSTEGHWTPDGWVFDLETSPCIDAGDPSSPFENEPIPNGDTINMGAYGNTTEASKSPPSEKTLTYATNIDNTKFANGNVFEYSISPNPFKNNTEIKCLLTSDVFVNITVYNLMGNKVKNITSGINNDGDFSYKWNGNDNNDRKLPVGIYILIIKTTDEVFSEKIILGN